MATLEQLADRGELIKHEPDLERHEFPTRFAYFSPIAETWLYATLRRAPRDRGRDLLPYEQVEELLYEFAIGRPMAYDVGYRKLDPLSRHVWELKTEDVRLIGWFPRKRHFVAVCGRMKRELQSFRYYAPYIECAAQFRSGLDLDEPKAITGVKYHDVL